jgi:hypothetical protein
LKIESIAINVGTTEKIQYRCHTFDYTSKEKVMDYTERDRDKVTIYLWVKDGKKAYLVDLNMQKYIP